MKKTYIISLMVLLFLSWASWFAYGHFKKTDTKAWENSTILVKTGSIRSTIKTLGTIKPVTSQDLSFAANGKVTKIHVKSWDQVKKWQILSELDTRDIQNEIKGQELSRTTAQTNYDKLYTPPEKSSIVSLKNNLAQTQLAIQRSDLEMKTLLLERDAKIQDQNELIRSLTSKLAINKAKIETMKQDIDYTQQQGENTIVQNKVDNDALAKSILLWAESLAAESRSVAFDLKNSVLHIGVDGSNPPAVFGAKGGNIVDQVKTKYAQLQLAITTFEQTPALLSKSSDVASLKSLQAAQTILIDTTLNLINATSSALDSSVEDVNTFPKSTITSLMDGMNSSRSKFNSLSSSINNNSKQLASLDNTDLTQLSVQNTLEWKKQSFSEIQSEILANEASLKAAKIALEKLQLDYTLKIAQQQDSTVSSQWSLELTKLNLEDIQAPPKKSEQTLALAQIEQANLNLKKSQKKLEDYQIIAPFDGIVRNIGFHVGDTISSTNAITIEVPWVYELSVALDQLDIVKVQPWQSAVVTLDAYPDRILTGSVASIDPTPTTDQWVVTYKAKILLEEHEKQIYSQMSATATIIIQEKRNIIVVPSTAIQTNGRQKQVEVVTKGKNEMRTVKTGISNGNSIEIISWLSADEEITNKSFQSTLATPRANTTTSTNAFNIWWAWWRSDGGGAWFGWWSPRWAIPGM